MCRPSSVSSFDDLFDRIWRSQSIAFSYVIYGVDPVEQELYDGGSEVVSAYLQESARLRGELKRENPVLVALTKVRSPGKIVEQKRESNDNK